MPPAKAKQDDSVVRIEVENESYEIDPDTLTWGEAAEIETEFDASLDKVDFESARGTIMLVYLAKRRRHPKTTLAEIKALPLGAITAKEPARPTKAPARSGART